jgi:hypothetical protein
MSWPDCRGGRPGHDVREVAPPTVASTCHERARMNASEHAKAANRALLD